MIKFKHCITLIISIIFILCSFGVVISTSAMPLSNMNVGIHADSTGSFLSIRQFERLNKMQSYIFPVADYNDCTSIDPFETFTSYLPVNIPQFIVFRDNISNEYSNTDLSHMFNIYSYTSNENSATSTTTFVPISFDQVTDSKFVYRYQLNLANNNSISSQKEYWHGVTYSIYNGDQLTGFSVSSPSNSNGSNIVYIKGLLETVYSVFDSNGIPQYYSSIQLIDNYYLLNPGNTLSITHALDQAVLPLDYTFAMTRFSGDIMVRYGNTQNTRVIYEENVSHDFASVLSFDDSNLIGFTPGEDDIGVSGVPISEYYQQMWARTLSSTITPDTGNILITTNGTYNVSNYATATVNVPQTVSWSGLFDWIMDSFGAFLGFEIAPGWTLGIIMTIVIGLAVVIWVLKVFLGG